VPPLLRGDLVVPGGRARAERVRGGSLTGGTSGTCACCWVLREQAPGAPAPLGVGVVGCCSALVAVPFRSAPWGGGGGCRCVA
jgi:hypothetical protein